MQLDGVNYLIPIGADIRNEDEVEDEAVSANRVMRKMKSAGNDLNMVFLDACRNNPYKGSFRSANRGLAAVMNAPKGSLISYATGAGNVAADGSGRNGTYTKNLLAAINTPNLELSQMMKRVRTGVQRDTNDEQTPYELSSLTGNFYFQGGPVAPRQTVVQTQPLPGPALTINAEESLWKAIENSKDILDFQDYLAAFPSGRFVVIARIKIRRLKRAASPRPVPRTPVAKIIPPANNRGRRDPASGVGGPVGGGIRLHLRAQGARRFAEQRVACRLDHVLQSPSREPLVEGGGDLLRLRLPGFLERALHFSVLSRDRCDRHAAGPVSVSAGPTGTVPAGRPA